eukprot:4647405-Prymnesium_polylepis.2
MYAIGRRRQRVKVGDHLPTLRSFIIYQFVKHFVWNALPEERAAGCHRLGADEGGKDLRICV